MHEDILGEANSTKERQELPPDVSRGGLPNRSQVQVSADVVHDDLNVLMTLVRLWQRPEEIHADSLNGTVIIGSGMRGTDAEFWEQCIDIGGTVGRM